MTAQVGHTGGRRLRTTVSEVMAYGDQFQEFARQIAALDLDAEEVLTVQMLSDGTLVGVADGRDAIIVRKDVNDAG